MNPYPITVTATTGGYIIYLRRPWYHYYPGCTLRGRSVVLTNSRLTHMGKKMLPVESVPTVYHVHISYGPRTITMPGHNQIPVKEI